MPNETNTKLQYRADDSSAICVGPPLIQDKHFLSFQRDGQIVGRVEATFNLEHLPHEFHESAYNILSKRGVRVVCQDTKTQLRQSEELAAQKIIDEWYRFLPWYKKIAYKVRSMTKTQAYLENNLPS